MFDRWFTPQESRGILAILGSLIIGSLVLVAGRSVPEIGDDLHIQPESKEEALQNSLYESRDVNEKKDSLFESTEANGNKDSLFETSDNKEKKDTVEIAEKNSKSQKQIPDKKPEKKQNPTALLPASININSASKSVLQKLPGIGPGKASTIIEYRETEGGFKKTKDITNVKGIGPKTYEKLKVYLTIE